MQKNSKVLLIDPWAINNTGDYTNGLAYGLSMIVELTLITNHFFVKTKAANYQIKRFFFKKSQNMNTGIIRKIIRSIEYILAYNKIIKFLKQEKKQFDVIHINWLLMYKIDKYYLKILKKYCNMLVYTAHNVIPHNEGEKYLTDLKTIYSFPDIIILHGENVKQEFTKLFPKYLDKVYVQKHGCNLISRTEFSEQNVDKAIKKKVSSYEQVFIFFGNIFYNKGTDRLIKYWVENCSAQKTLLIVAGRIVEQYKELTALESQIEQTENILYIKEYVEDNLLNYFIAKSNLVIMPYRHASMSGAVFTAADFKKPVLCTRTGAIEEYLQDNVDSFIVSNTEQALGDKLNYILKQFPKHKLLLMGEQLQENIANTCSWKVITEKIVRECYKTDIQ